MGKRGPKKTPTNILKLRGSRRAADRPKNEPKPKLGIPEPPEILGNGVALDEWYNKVQMLYEQGTLTLIDDMTLAAYCLSYEIAYYALKECRNKQGKLDITVKSQKNNKIQNPALSIYKTALRDMAKFAAEFGMTPSGRTGINVPVIPKTQTPAQKWLAKQG